MTDIGSIKPHRSEGQRLAAVSIRAEEHFLKAVKALVTDIARTYPFSKREIERLDELLLEICRNVIRLGYEGDRSQFIDIIIEEGNHSLVVAVEDRGLPFDYQRLEAGGDPRFSATLAKGYADAVHFINKGREGNRVELVRQLPAEDYRDTNPHETEERIDESQTAHEEEAIRFRLMGPEEARELARVVYRCYGYSYACDFVYFPEKVESNLRSGHMISCIAVNSAGEMIGHLALTLPRPKALIAESGQAVVDPRYRGHGIFKGLKLRLRDHAAERNITGIYSEAVTVHPFSQKGNLALGAHEIGLLLGYSPGCVSFRSIAEEGKARRQSVALMYMPVGEQHGITVYPPAEYAGLLEKIYERNSLPRRIGLSARSAFPSSSHGSFQTTLRTDHNQAIITLTSVGRDSPESVASRVRQLSEEGIACVHADLLLTDKHSAWLGSELRKRGFFFGAVIPDHADGDILKMQYLNNVKIVPEDIHLASDFGSDLLQAILDDRQPA